MKSLPCSVSLVAWLLLVFGAICPARADKTTTTDNLVREETLGRGTPFETKLLVRQAAEEGPIVLLTGGMHGNEPAGAAAAEQISRWPLLRGTLLCVPRTNPPALAAVKRYSPDVPQGERNLNRNFVVSESAVETKGLMAEQLWQLVEQFQPDWVIDLHEGTDFSRISNSVGSSVIADRNEATREMARLMIEAVDAEIDIEDRKFTLRGPPIAGSLARASAEVRGIGSMILETTSKSQSLAVRCRQHRRMVATLLHQIGMVADTSVADRFVVPEHQPHWNVALYDDGGVGGNGIPAMLKLWGEQPNVTIDRVCGADIRAGVLDQFDVICCSGGSGSGQSRSLQDAGREEVRRFVEGGGSYVGICAGSYLACSGFSWGLGILDAKTQSSRWRRGRATLDIDLTDSGLDFFETATNRYPVRYANGPIIEPHHQDHLPDYEVLATFAGEVAENDTPGGIMVNSPAIVHSTFGAGRVLCISPHPEQSPDATELILRVTQRLSAPAAADGIAQ
jgi:predicted deacylase/glutamine amidotransferase-like uncharacterized protein